MRLQNICILHNFPLKWYLHSHLLCWVVTDRQNPLLACNSYFFHVSLFFLVMLFEIRKLNLHVVQFFRLFVFSALKRFLKGKNFSNSTRGRNHLNFISPPASTSSWHHPSNDFSFPYQFEMPSSSHSEFLGLFWEFFRFCSLEPCVLMPAPPVSVAGGRIIF